MLSAEVIVANIVFLPLWHFGDFRYYPNIQRFAEQSHSVPFRRIEKHR